MIPYLTLDLLAEPRDLSLRDALVRILAGIGFDNQTRRKLPMTTALHNYTRSKGVTRDPEESWLGLFEQFRAFR